MTPTDLTCSTLAAARIVIGANADEGLAMFLDALVDGHLVEPINESRSSNRDA